MKPTALKYTQAELAAAFRKSMKKVFSDMEANSKVAEAARNARIASANPRRK